MLKNRWRRSSSPAVWAVALVLGAPALVRAQTQLFPLAPIQRERVPCPMEDPVYGLYRHQYYGYFPTCWRPFPTGWGCPSPEAPNMAEAFKKLPRDKPREVLPAPEDMEEFGPLPGEEPEMPGGRNPLPPLPGGERSPFDIDRPPTAPDTPGGIPPRDDRGIPPEARRDAPVPGGPGPSGAGNAETAPLLTLPDPVEAPTTAIPPGPGGLLPGPAEPMGPPPLVNGPVPANSRPVMNPTSAAGVLAPTSVAPVRHPVTTSGGIAPPPPPVGPVTMPVQAPQRRGPLSTLFSGLSSKLRR